MPGADQAYSLLRGVMMAAAVLIPASRLTVIRPTPARVSLFRVVTIRGDLVLGLTSAEIAALGLGREIERLARRFAEEQALDAWLYLEGRGEDGAPLLASPGRVRVVIEDALLIEGFTTSLPVLPPPA